MHTATWLALQDELEKISGLGAGALDMAGLGMLAAPTVQKMRGKPMSDKNKDRMELGGLGVLGGSVAAEHAGDALKAGRSGLAKLKNFASRFPKHAGPSMGAMMNMHRLADAARASKSMGGAVSHALPKLPNAAQHASRAMNLGQHMATGGHAWNPAASAKRAISL